MDSKTYQTSKSAGIGMAVWMDDRHAGMAMGVNAFSTIGQYDSWGFPVESYAYRAADDNAVGHTEVISETIDHTIAKIKAAKLG